MAKKVIVFGSCNLDMFFDVPDMDFFVSTESGAQDALHFATHNQAPGGKGANQAVAAAKAGAKVYFYGAVGQGSHGRYLLDNFRNVGINTAGIEELNAPTGVAVIFNKPDGKHKAVVSHGANRLARQKNVPDKMLNENAILVFQAETSLKENAALMKRGKKSGAKVVFNVAPANKIPPEVLMCVDYLILNRPEAEVIADSVGMSARDLPLFAKAMAAKFHLTCIITLGELGVMAAIPGRTEMLMVPSLPIKAVDTIGAGDAFVGAFAAALSHNLPVETALEHGAIAGSLACTKMGAQAALPTGEEIEKSLSKMRKAKAAAPKTVARKKAA